MINFNIPADPEGYFFRKAHIGALTDSLRTAIRAQCRALLPSSRQILVLEGVELTVTGGTVNASAGWVYWRAKDELLRVVAPQAPILASGGISDVTWYLDTEEVLGDIYPEAQTEFTSISERVVKLASNDRFVNGDLMNVPVDDRLAGATYLYRFQAELAAMFMPEPWKKVGQPGNLQFVAGSENNDTVNPGGLWYRKYPDGRVVFRGGCKNDPANVNRFRVNLSSVDGYAPTVTNQVFVGHAYDDGGPSYSFMAAGINQQGGNWVLTFPLGTGSISSALNYNLDGVSYATN